MPLLGPGKLKKEFVVSVQCKGQYAIACDSYIGIPTTRVANKYEVFDILDGERLERIIKEHRLDIIVPKIEAIRVERLYDFEKEDIQIVSSAHAVNYTTDHKAIHNLATKELGLRTAKYYYIKSLEELGKAVVKIGFPYIVKPLMSSSGKKQLLIKGATELEHVWEYNYNGSHGDIRELIIEEFIKFNSEITLSTVTQKNGPMLFCPPIGHVQKGGDYRESFQPAHTDPAHLREAEEMAEKVTRALTGAGPRGAEFFLGHESGIYFSEPSPRPHDTGMVILTGTQNLSEPELCLRAVLGLPIPGTKQERIGAGVVILLPVTNQGRPQYRGMEEATIKEDTYLRVFGKPYTRVNRHMGVVLCYTPSGFDLSALHDKAKRITDKVKVY